MNLPRPPSKSLQALEWPDSGVFVSSAPNRILFVGNDASEVSHVQNVIGKMGAAEDRFDQAGTTEDAIHQLRTKKHFVLLYALRASEELTRARVKEIRARVSDVPIVVLTDKDQDQEFGESLITLGALDYLPIAQLNADTLIRCFRYVKKVAQLERAKDEETQKFESIFENVPDSAVILDRRFQFIKSNSAANSLFGKTEVELTGKLFTDFLSDSDAAVLKSATTVKLRGEFAVQLANSRKKNVGGSLMPNFLNDNHLIIMSDLDERRQYKEFLDQAEFRFRKLFESDIMGIFLTDASGVILEANAKFLRMTGYDTEDLKDGQISWPKITVPGYEQGDKEGLRQLAEKGNCPAYEKAYFRKNGEQISVLVGAVVLSKQNGNLLAFALDITKNKELEKQFLELQKLEAVGLLAGGVAHDFNNILGIILLHAESIEAREITPESISDITTIRKSAERAAKLTRQLLNLSHKKVFNKANMSPNSVITEMEQMFRRLLGESINVRLELTAEDPQINMDQSQFEQILMNLFVNAKDAMPAGGTLTVRTKISKNPKNFRQSSGAAIESGQHVEISVTDTGHGMTEEVRRNIFNPFFTTKALGKGTGLGLATAFGIIQQNSGFIDVTSAPGEGAMFEIHFPISTLTEASLKPTNETSAELVGAQRTILLVEDDANIRTPTMKLLKSRGFLVLEAENGKAAFDIFKNSDQRISLIVSDVIMPEMSGAEMLRKIRGTNQGRNLPVLFLSGYSSDELATYGVSRDSADFLEKPFNSKVLLNKITEILGRQT